MTWAIENKGYSQASRLRSGRHGSTRRPLPFLAAERCRPAQEAARAGGGRRRLGYRRLHLLLTGEGVAIN